MGSRQRKTNPTQIGFSFICGLPLLLQSKNNFGTLHFLKIMFKRPNMPSPYEKLSRACLWEWYTTSGGLKPNYKHVMQVGTTVKSNKKSMCALEDYLEVYDSIVVML